MGNIGTKCIIILYSSFNLSDLIFIGFMMVILEYLHNRLMLT